MKAHSLVFHRILGRFLFICILLADVAQTECFLSDCHQGTSPNITILNKDQVKSLADR